MDGKWPVMPEWWGLREKCSLPIYKRLILVYTVHDGIFIYIGNSWQGPAFLFAGHLTATDICVGNKAIKA